MVDQSASQIGAIFLAIQQLSPSDRRRLQRRLSISGLLDPDEILTDQHPLDVAPALGKGIKQWRKAEQEDGRALASPSSADSSDSSTVSDEVGHRPDEDPPTAVTPLQTGAASAISEVTEVPEYRSSVSGKVVIGPPTQAIPDDPHAMPPVPGQAPEEPIVLIFDGGSKGNPGKGYGSFALRWPGQTEQIVQLQFGDQVTNNEAEYDTLIAALSAVQSRLDDLGADTDAAELVVYGDSLLVINQVKGEWQCKEPRLISRRDRAQMLLSRYGRWRLIHHDRSKSVEVLGH